MLEGFYMQDQQEPGSTTSGSHDILATSCATRVQREERMVKREPMLERRDEAMPEPGGYFELGGCLSSFVYDHDTSWR